MMAEGIHSAADSFNQFLLYMGNRQGKIGPCHRYPLGRGRAIYLFNLLASIGILFGAFYTINHGLHILQNMGAHTKIKLSIASFVILGLSMAVEGVIFYKALKEVLSRKGELGLWKYIKETDDPSVIGILLEDGIALLGASCAIIGIFLAYQTQSILPDVITTFLIGVMLVAMAIFLFKVNYDLIVGVRLPKEHVEKIKSFIRAQSGVERIIHFQSEVLAPSKARLSLEIEFSGYHIGFQEDLRRTLKKISQNKNAAATIIDTRDRTVRNLGNLIDQLESQLKAEFPYIAVIDVEPN